MGDLSYPGRAEENDVAIDDILMQDHQRLGLTEARESSTPAVAETNTDLRASLYPAVVNDLPFTVTIYVRRLASFAATGQPLLLAG